MQKSINFVNEDVWPAKNPRQPKLLQFVHDACSQKMTYASVGPKDVFSKTLKKHVQYFGLLHMKNVSNLII